MNASADSFESSKRSITNSPVLVRCAESLAHNLSANEGGTPKACNLFLHCGGREVLCRATCRGKLKFCLAPPGPAGQTRAYRTDNNCIYESYRLFAKALLLETALNLPAFGIIT